MFVILLAFLFTKRGHFLAIQWETASWIIQILSSLIVEHEILGGRKKDYVKVGNLQGIKCQVLHKRPKYIARKCPRQCCAGKFFTDCKRLCEWETILLPRGKRVLPFFITTMSAQHVFSEPRWFKDSTFHKQLEYRALWKDVETDWSITFPRSLWGMQNVHKEHRSSVSLQHCWSHM